MQTASGSYLNKGLFKTILFAGLLAGTLDAVAAIINYYAVTGKNPVIIFEYIASGIFGKQAYSNTQLYAIFGLLLHYLIAVIFSAFYFWMYPKIKFLQSNRLASAFLLGIFAWVVMNQLVVPLAITHAWTFQITKALLALSILIVCIGLPITFMADSFYKNRERT